ncbi:MAG: amino acid ABC transporter permease [Clostridia bacterium]|nr:amino acid ABC transporter permease [Clostridia bacterium]
MSFMQVTESLTAGFLENCKLFTLTLLMALPLGLLVAAGSMTRFRPIRWLSRMFVWVIRSTPLMLQLFVVLYAPGLLFGTPMKSRMTAALLAFVINYAAYFSEIYRGGIEGIPQGQYEAGQVLGLTRMQIFWKIIFMQVIKRILPPMSNEVLTLVKDTSLARVIAISELLMSAERFAGKGLIWPLFFTGIYFLLFCGGLTLLFSYIEKKLDYYKG